MNTKTTVVLALLVVIGGILLVLERPWQDASKPPTADDQLQAGRPKPLVEPSLDAEVFQGVELIVGRQPPIITERDGAGWKITQPLQCVAEPWLPTNLIRRCLDLRYSRKFAPRDQGAPSTEEAGLDDPLVTVTLHRPGDQPPLVFRFGRQAPLSTDYYAALNGDDHIYVVNEDVPRTFKRTLQEFRSKKIFDFGSDEVESVAVAGTRNYKLVRAQDQAWMIHQPVRARANKSRAASLASSLRNLRAQDFVDDQPDNLVPYGLDRPAWTVALTVEKTIQPETPGESDEATESAEPAQPADQETEDQQTPADVESPPTPPQPTAQRTEHVLLIGGPAGQNRYAKLADRPWVFTIPETTLTSLTPELLDLRDKTLCDFDRRDVEKIELQVAAQHDTITNQDGTWILANGRRAEPIAVDDLLKTIEHLQAASFEDRPPLVDTGLDSPRATVAVTLTGQLEPLSLVIGNPTTSGKMVYARSGDDPSIAILRQETIAALLVPPIGYRDRQILDFNKSHAANIEITRRGRTFSLVESFGLWRLTAPVDAPADASSVSNILADLNNLRAKTVVAADSGSAYGLDDPWVRAAVTVQPPPQPLTTAPAQTETQPAEAETRPALVGPPPQTYALLMAATPDGKIYARLEDGKLVYQVDHQVLDNLLAELHDRQAFPIDQDTRITKLAFRNRDRAFALEKVGRNKWIADADTTLPIDANKVDGEISTLRELKTGEFVSYHTEDLTEFGLDDPAVEVALTDRLGETHRLQVSAQGPENDPEQSRYATMLGSNKVFLLPLDRLGPLNMTLTDFEKAE